jgi:transglutaminase-like putative cysteine protease
VSVAAPATVLGRGRGRPASPARGLPRHRAARRSAAAFTLLGLLGVLRWQTMLASPPTGRMLGLLGLAVAVVGLGALIAGRSRGLRLLLIAGIILCALGMIPMSGLPLAWFMDVRIAVTARAIGHGLSTLSGVIVPLHGHDRATRAVIALGAGLLLLGSALALAASRVPRGEARLAAAALPLVVLATVPSALARPHVAYLHGLLLFVVLALFVFSERIRPAAGGSAAAVLAAAALGGVLLSPVVDGREAWISFTKVKIAGVGAGTGTGAGERFDWSQTYGPLVWPHTGATVLEVRARFPAYWKAEDLDTFDGAGWSATPVPEGNPMAGVSPASEARWTETVTFHVHGLHTSQVIAAGVAGPPLLPGNPAVEGGSEPGTYVSTVPLAPGTSYQVRAYVPRPTPAELERAPTGPPPAGFAGELRMQLPAGGGGAGQPPVIQFAPYADGAAPVGTVDSSAAEAASALNASAYGPIYALSQRLRTGTASPYGYVRAVLRYLAHGYRYIQDPPVDRLPVVSFLLRDRAGYCQQFAGAMALLLRMGGIPARVAAGFATGAFDSVRRDYIVGDFDAHAWVEAWFNGYGWVTFDPTPAADPALAGRESIQPAFADVASHQQKQPVARHVVHRAGVGSARATRTRAGGGEAWALLVTLVASLLLLAAITVFWFSRRGPVTPAELLVELERAYARCGRPLPSGTTLATLEIRLADSPQAAAYVRSLRVARYGSGADVRPPVGRWAVRRRLRDGLGPMGWLRSFAALPPRPGSGLH